MATGPRTPLIRRVALLLAVLFAGGFGGIVGLAPAAASAAPTPTTPTTTTAEATGAASAWLAAQMVDGNRLTDFGISDSPGLTIDAMLAFASAGVEKDRVASALAWLSQSDVAGNYARGFGTQYFAGATAKVVLVFQVAGADPTDVNGVDLVAELLKLQSPSGRFQDTAPGVLDDSNAFDQALAMLALARTPTGVPAAATAFALGTQCASGGFPISLDGSADSCTGDVDATGMITQALLAAGQGEAAAAAIAWLVKVQDSGGGFEAGIGGLNSNSAGLAGEALRAFGEDAAADRAVAYIRGLQVGCGGDPANVGGIAYGATDPADPDNTGFQLFNAPRATAQAILALAGVPLGKIAVAGAEATGATFDCRAPATTTIGGAAGLPVTGSSLTGVVVAGAALVVVGGGLLFVVRRRRDVTAP